MFKSISKPQCCSSMWISSLWSSAARCTSMISGSTIGTSPAAWQIAAYLCHQRWLVEDTSSFQDRFRHPFSALYQARSRLSRHRSFQKIPPFFLRRDTNTQPRRAAERSDLASVVTQSWIAASDGFTFAAARVLAAQPGSEKAGVGPRKNDFEKVLIWKYKKNCTAVI